LFLRTDVEIHKTDSIMVLFCFMQRIPMWWIWLYYICPTSWALEGMFTSQYGDLDKEISVFGETKTASAFIEDYFGYRQDFLGVVGLVLIIIPIVIASLFTYFIGKLNFQRR